MMIHTDNPTIQKADYLYHNCILQANFRQVEQASVWYHEAYLVAQEVATNMTIDIERAACIVAAFSPRERWSVNVRKALQYSIGVTPSGLSNNVAMADASLVHGFDALKGLKTNAFARAIAGDNDAVVIDVWMMRAAGMHVLLGGNIRGVSTLALLDQVTPESVALMELDSWQCQGWGESKMSPHVAVFTTFMRDHMDYYKDDMGAYLLDKAQIFIHQQPEDTFVVSEQVLPQLTQYQHASRAHVRVARAGDLELSVPGAHNQLNAACALEAARALGIDDAITLPALKAFSGVEGRLQFVREVNGVKFYNDTTATTPQALLVALQSVGGARTVAIVGGKSKNIDVSALTPALAMQKHVVYLAGTGTEELGVRRAHTALKAAFDEALAHAESGDTVLLSPGFSSKDMFLNEYDRGDQYDAMVRSVPNLQELRPQVRARALALIEACKKEGFTIVISRGYRTAHEQEMLYERGRTGPGSIVTHARGGESFHNYGVAFDIRPVVPDEHKEEFYRRAGPLGEALGLSWGGRWESFVDLPHFEYTAGYTIDDFKRNQIDESKFA